MLKNPLANAGDARDTGSIPGSGRSLGGGNGNPLQYSCLENPMDRGAWWATVHRVAKSQTQLSNFTFTSLSFSLTLIFSATPPLKLDSILKSKDITLPTKVCLVKAMVFPVVMYGSES